MRPSRRRCRLGGASAGFTCVQVRSKVCSARELMACADEAARAIERAGASEKVALLIDDRLDVAFAAREAGVKVDGVHVGSPTFPLKRAASSSAPMRSWVSPPVRTRCLST